MAVLSECNNEPPGSLKAIYVATALGKKVSSETKVCGRSVAIALTGPFITAFKEKVMGTTAAERKRLQRERLKEKGLYQEYVKKETEKKRHLRKLFKERASKEARETLKKKRKEEQRKYRFKKQQAKTNAGNANSVNELGSPAYKTRASFGKAVAKAKRALPASPRKRSTVVRALFKNVNPAEIKAKKRTSCNFIRNN
ncbi:hypothetical protein ANN_26696 [Periplaneta americana]|uniref:Uncharacterized protein n=1 Tax=Periplaneta americana TaxID=6978 RepID=A0ABQ8RYS2_PERAM|nr:hypothetical protein ANN_26696 [Periplaneta americana]